MSAALWHWDFHHGSRRVLTVSRRWQTPFLLGILDDRSRLVCHLERDRAEAAELPPMVCRRRSKSAACLANRKLSISAVITRNS